MARYIHDYQETTGDALPPRGMDPNYEGRYRGMRMGAEPGQGAYGWYRWRHARELGGSDFAGDSLPREPGARRYDRGYRPDFHEWEMHGGGGLRDPRHDRDFLRGFNANTPDYHRDPRARQRYELEYRQRGSHPHPHDATYRFSYGNRGVTRGGFSDAWPGWGR